MENIIGHKDKRSYEQAVQLIDDTIRTLFAECGRPEDFAAYVDDVRASHKQKRNLMKLMSELRTAGIR